MSTVREELEKRLVTALERAGAPPGTPAMVQPATRPEFGDYQANGVMGAAKRMGAHPRQLAETVVERAELSAMVASVEVAGPGFLNIRLLDSWLGERLTTLAARVLWQAMPATRDKPRVVVDYSSPNLAKEMHVGHLRSTILGDAVARTLAHLGHAVIRQNHVGDWGTQFGMLLAFMDARKAEHGRDELEHELADLESFYRNAKASFDSDHAFAERARNAVVRLQSGDPHYVARWREFIEVSLSHCEGIYHRLGVSLRRADIRGESAYNAALPDIVTALKAQRLLSEDQGAQCVFLEAFKGKDDKPLPVIVQKSDGGYLYATTDLAAVRYRARELRADRVLYFVDARQTLHFEQIFAVARAAGFADAGTHLEHLPFGTMLGEDGRPFQTRAGDVVKLDELLDEAERRAFTLVGHKNPGLDAAEQREIARAVGIGAVKYADLSKHREQDYVFRWDSILSFEGNTAPYLQYAYTRVRSLFRRAGIDMAATSMGMPADPAERTLALRLVRLPETLGSVARDGLPHLLCTHLYEIAVAFMAFYEQCPVLSAPAETRERRLSLAAHTAAALKTGLGLLGIDTVERM